VFVRTYPKSHKHLIGMYACRLILQVGNDLQHDCRFQRSTTVVPLGVIMLRCRYWSAISQNVESWEFGMICQQDGLCIHVGFQPYVATCTRKLVLGNAPG
jgi:hypothetical protein